MARAHLISAFVLALLAASALPASAPAARAAETPLIVVMSSKTPVTDVSVRTLRRVFQGLPTDYQAGKLFIPVNHPTGSRGRVRFDRALLGLEPDQVGPFWIDRRIRDESLPPRTAPSAELALRVVAAVPGAITYIEPQMLVAKVRTLTIDGKSPNQAGYLLR